VATVGEACVRLLEQYGVETVFGIPGVHTLELYRGLACSPIRHVSPVHEQGAGFMADGHGRVRGEPGVCLVITGAGVTNIATPVASALHDSRPLLVLSSATARADRRRGHGPLHDLPDQQRFMSSITVESIEVDEPDALADAFRRAWDVFESRRPGPVHIGVPIDVLEMPAAAAERLPSAAARPSPATADLDAAGALLAGAARPMLLLGGGARGAAESARALAERVGAPVVTTINGKGVVPADHPLSVGSTLTLAAVVEELEAADAVVAVGTEFSETDYFYAPRLPDLSRSLIRVDIDAGQLAKRRAPRVALHGDADEVLRALLERVAGAAGDRDGAARTAALRGRLAWWPEARPFLPVLDALADALPAEAVVVADSTQPAYVANHYLPARRPASYLAPAGFGTLGPALPMAIGAKLGAPGRPVACLVGDGGLLFTAPELVTAAGLGLPVAVLVWQNRGYAEMRDSMDRVGVPRLGTETTAPDLAALAAGLGCRHAHLDQPAALAATLADAFSADRPTVVELAADSFIRSSE
jgi:acetolactate synthase-1/2/3 large subunit